MKNKIIEYLQEQHLKENKYCDTFTKSDDIALCRIKYVMPIEEMILHLKDEALNDELLSYTPEKSSAL